MKTLLIALSILIVGCARTEDVARVDKMQTDTRNEFCYRGYLYLNYHGASIVFENDKPMRCPK